MRTDQRHITESLIRNFNLRAAFLIPLLEKLYRSRWDSSEGLGALIISPTRELALQIFEVLRSIGKTHSFSAGLIIGGKNFKEEQFRLGKMNIIVCTPGRLLQHLEQTPNFDVSTLQMLVLDEADRIMDMGFSAQVNSILTYLPVERQTLLFSATQTKSIKHLATLSLNEPEYIAVHEQSKHATPHGLTQNYVVCDLGAKLNILIAFIKSHLKQKTIVFLSTCRQVRFVYQLLCKLQPGVPLCALHGKYKQGKRVEIYYEFLNKPAAVMFATDIAARGLDFPSVNWVFQMDCPENVASYIHRVGRTARYNSQGKALLCLLPSEVQGMKQALEEAKIEIKELKINPQKTSDYQQKIQSILAADKEIKTNAQKAFMSYVRSIFLQPDKKVFQTSKLPLDAFAQSLGLLGAPRMAFLDQLQDAETDVNGENLRAELRAKKNVNRKLQQLKDKIKAEKQRKRQARESSKASKPDAEMPLPESSTLDEDAFLTVRCRYEPDDEIPVAVSDTRERKKHKKIRLDVHNSSRKVFDDEGYMVNPLEQIATQEYQAETSIRELEAQSEAFAAKVAARLKEQESEDRKREKERIRAKHQKKRLKMKGALDQSEDFASNSVQLNIAGSDENESTEGDAGSTDDDSEDHCMNAHSSITDHENVALSLLQKR